MALRIGIVGCGKIAGNHAQALQQVPGVEVIGCCDPDLDRAQAFAAAHGIGRAVRSMAELLDLGLDACTVCTPHPVHEQVVVAAAEAAIHVLCEKPIAVDVAAADRMIEAADHAGITFGVLFQRRFWPAARRIKAAIDDGRLGVPVLGEASVLLHRPSTYYSADAWRGRWDTDGGGVLMTQAVHQIDMLQWFMGEAVSVSGFIRTHTHGEHIETEDSASAVVSFASGGTATVTATTGANHNLGNRVTVIGQTGAIASVLEFPEGREGVNEIWTLRSELEFRTPFSPGVHANLDVGDVNAGLADFHTLQVQDFADAVLTGRAPAVTGRDARASLAIVAAVYESSRTGRVVNLAPVPTLATIKENR
ncbi:MULTISPECIES: Gfo/Idh/MocA family protein [unclassified Rhodococcus (in: high G+C Gram-positive bacteria)]|uniref:Gfo/Idh/MocA family protein n=1 Tax=unclassified Rhodococcus (in: high G+C Gram-positive bacteria) TaxID=192944 RepID=UPI00163A94D8|nr:MULTISPECIES: Gfo/Idh/MocA family oxidoreductase [unclassified Rhodococcus (in: high G+C Gram-positive bacteria)]MBC2639231.1 Gfo/Idh/MocA family oxidoreductase [Rhodococcus sp. 3A]MBC2896024.1 Gfo/Idh/MocA family oxidoreductase [Rhodococcus sp. 4CII]